VLCLRNASAERVQMQCEGRQVVSFSISVLLLWCRCRLQFVVVGLCFGVCLCCYSGLFRWHGLLIYMSVPFAAGRGEVLDLFPMFDGECVC